MKKLTKIIFVVLAAVVLISAVSVLTPRAVRAAVATLIQDVDSPPRNPWTATCTIDNTTGDNGFCIIPATPGYEIVIQAVTIQGYTSDNHEHLVLELVSFTGGIAESWNNQVKYVSTMPEETLANLPDWTGVNQHSYASTQAATLYVDPTQHPGLANTIHIFIRTTTGNPHGMGAIVNLVGYVANIGASAN